MNQANIRSVLPPRQLPSSNRPISQIEEMHTYFVSLNVSGTPYTLQLVRRTSTLLNPSMQLGAIDHMGGGLFYKPF